MFEVNAIAKGYYGGKVRVPGETFGITDADHFSVEWMDSSDAKVIAFAKDQANLKGKVEADMTLEEKRREHGKDERAARHRDWLDGHGHEAEAEKPAGKPKAADRIALAKELTGRDDITTAKEADQIIEAAGGDDAADASADTDI